MTRLKKRKLTAGFISWLGFHIEGQYRQNAETQNVSNALLIEREKEFATERANIEKAIIATNEADRVKREIEWEETITYLHTI